MDDTDRFLGRLVDVAPDLTEQQTTRIHQLLGEVQPSPGALAGVQQLLNRDTPKVPR